MLLRVLLCFLWRRHGGAAAAYPSDVGQRWKKKMEAENLRAARETFRERNPLVKVGHTHDGSSVLKVSHHYFFMSRSTTVDAVLAVVEDGSVCSLTSGV